MKATGFPGEQNKQGPEGVLCRLAENKYGKKRKPARGTR